MSVIPSPKRVSDPGRKARTFQVSYSSQFVAENDDLLSEILLRSPPKSLLQFKFVSKKWLSLISDEHFRRRYAVDRLNRPPRGLFLIYNKESSKDYEFFPVVKVGDSFDKVNSSLKFLNAPSDYVKILQCCNGLSLCRSIRKCVRYESETRVTHYVCNLSTKEFIVLPPFYPRVKKVYHHIFLAFDPIVSPHYKVICAHIQRRKMKNFHEIEIYSSKTGSWNPTTVSHPAAENCGFYDANYFRISWNGWIIWPYGPWIEHKCLYFDSDRECMKTMKLPEQLSTASLARPPKFASCGSRFFILDLVRIKPQLRVYELERGDGNWSMKYQVSSDDMAVLCPTIYSIDSACRILSGLPGEEEDDFFLVIRLEKKLVYYSLKDKSSRKIVDCRHYWSYCSEIHQHFETLSCP